jgi:hypothetical protein
MSTINSAQQNMIIDSEDLHQKNYNFLLATCNTRMVLDSLLMSHTDCKEKEAEYQRDFNNYKFYEI